MSLQKLKMLREKAWIPTPLGDKFSLHFDDTLYLQLVAQYIIDDMSAYSCVGAGDGVDLYADGYQEGYNSAISQVTQDLRARYAKPTSPSI
jgi:hypothetical protein